MSSVTTAPGLPSLSLESFVRSLPLVEEDIPSWMNASSAHSSSVDSLGSEVRSVRSNSAFRAPNTAAATSASASRGVFPNKTPSSALGRATVLDCTPGLNGTAMTKSFCDQLSAVKSANPTVSICDYLGVSEGEDPRHKEELWKMSSEWAGRVKRRKTRQVVRCNRDKKTIDVSDVDLDVLTGAMFEKRLHEEDQAGGATTIERIVTDDGIHVVWTYRGNGWQMTNRRPKTDGEPY